MLHSAYTYEQSEAQYKKNNAQYKDNSVTSFDTGRGFSNSTTTTTTTTTTTATAAAATAATAAVPFVVRAVSHRDPNLFTPSGINSRNGSPNQRGSSRSSSSSRLEQRYEGESRRGSAVHREMRISENLVIPAGSTIGSVLAKFSDSPYAYSHSYSDS